MHASDDLRYPIGRMPAFDDGITAQQREAWIRTIEELPEKLRLAVRGFTPERWDTPYRPGGWTVRQVVHHLPDSHVNAYVRVKMALTEDEPTIKPYDEAAWAELADTRETDPEVSLALLEALHSRWAALWRSLPEAAFRRAYRHPEHHRTFTLGQVLGMYAWHSEHHLRHVTALCKRMMWT